MTNRNEEDTIDYTNKSETISDLPLSNQLAEQLKAGTGAGSREQFDYIVVGSGPGGGPLR